jgi:glycosidase
MKQQPLKWKSSKPGRCDAMKKFFSLYVLVIFFHGISCAQVEVYPSNWWTGMAWNKVQLMIHRPRVAKEKISLLPYPGVKLLAQKKVENENYLFIDLLIDKSAKPGQLHFRIENLQSPEAVTHLDFYFLLKQKRAGNGTAFAQGITSKDLVYLLMPDRFSNGDPSNDRMPSMLDQSLNRDSIFYRHGGDLQGVINHLDYLKDLGVTTIWMTPVLENNVQQRSEHGYGFTNHYHIDPRLGGAEMYSKLSDAIHAKGMKLIQDAVYNHVGYNHFTVTDPPMKSWLNQWPAYTQTNYKDQTVFDPHGAPSDKKIMQDGWFQPLMPDLDEQNPFVANYLIQHAIWCVENFGVDGWRIDTYAYNDLDFMNHCNAALVADFPKITEFGETWVHGVPNQSFFCQNNYIAGFKSNLQGTTDFQELFYGIQAALNESFGWTDGVNKLYTTTAQDFLYKDPMREVIFLGNHDLSRFYSVVGEDTAKYKMALGWLMTFRGIPQLYYGDEILMTGFSNPDGLVRHDFPGGWPGDADNKFIRQGRTEKEENIFQYTRALAHFRASSSAITTGKLMQHYPIDGVYTYFRYDEKQTVMVIMNTMDKEKTIDLNRFSDRTKNFTKGKNIISGNEMRLDGNITIGAREIWIMELSL